MTDWRDCHRNTPNTLGYAEGHQKARPPRPPSPPRPATIAPDSITKRTNTPLGHVLGLVKAYVLVVEPDTNIPDVIINSTIDPAVNDAGS